MIKQNRIAAFWFGLFLSVILVQTTSARSFSPGADFVEKPLTIRSKIKEGTEYCLLSYNELSLQVVISSISSYENSNVAGLRLLKNAQPISEWFYTAAGYPENEFKLFYSESLKSYYLIQSLDVDEWEKYDVYYIESNKVTFEGTYEPVSKQAYVFYESPAWYYRDSHTTLSREGNKTRFTYVDDHEKEVLEFLKYVANEKPDTEEEAVDEQQRTEYLKPLTSKLSTFDWEKGFVPQYVYNISFDFNEDNKKEAFEINWQKRSIKPLNVSAQQLRKDDHYKDNIVFKGDTLLILGPDYGRGPDEIQGTYKFTISKNYNVALLSAYTDFRFTNSSFQLKKYGNEVTCFGSEDYFLYNGANAIRLEDFTFDRFDKRDKQYDYGRRYTLNGLYEIVLKKEGTTNSIFNSCSPLPNTKELDMLVKSNPVTVKNVQKYNDMAFYFQGIVSEFESLRYELFQCSLFLLHKVLNAFPDRIVAWLNFGDVRWESAAIYKSYDKQAFDAYNKYLELMKAQGKDMNKVPARVYQRLEEYKKDKNINGKK
ncbi:hypothetical protein AAEO56_03875 [Flavobacterium sp. DGU11]|uniref:YARHG domain-containing protein n=1 Tax=Flavobacterium arundinis TaxID=3139143 RepID=A0ABU9HTG0_9FLAO